jgi:hypothetical protein
MKLMQPNENASRDMWIKSFEGDWQKGFWGG